MWTHLQPYLDDDFTAQSITRHARVALWRAINLRRLVVLAGSGVSRAYGLPSWAALGDFYIRATQDELFEVFPSDVLDVKAPRPSREILDLIAQINRLCGAESGESDGESKLSYLTETRANDLADLTIIMDLCEELLKKLPPDGAGATRLHRARLRFTDYFRSGEAGLTLSRLDTLFRDDIAIVPAPGPPAKDKPLGDAYLQALYSTTKNNYTPNRAAHDLSKSVPLEPKRRRSDGSKNAQAPFRIEDIRIKGDTSPQPFEYSQHSNQKPKEDLSRDPVRAIFENLGASRVLTLNYDVQFERWLLSRLKAEQDDTASAFQAVCRLEKATSPIEPRVEIKNGLRKGALSVSLNQTNVGELVNFAAYSRTYDHQVFHLHGRLDDPDNLVLTQHDYRRVYLRDQLGNQNFKAAQEILFGGNDVLMLGIGMSEDDVMRPFRRFISRGREPSDSPGRTFVLMPSDYSKNWHRKNDEIAVRHAVNFGIYTLFIGGDRYRKVMAALGDIEDPISVIKKQEEKKKKPFSSPIKLKPKRIQKLLSSLREFSTPTDKKNTNPQSEALLQFNEIELLADVIESLGKNKARAAPVTATIAIIEELKSRVRTRALVFELSDLRKGSGDWWDTWRHPPHERRARYHLASNNISGAEDYLWVRHCPDYRRPDSDLKWQPLLCASAQSRRLQIPGEANYHTARQSGRRILRLTMPRGGGKGFLVSLLLHKEMQEELFQSQNGTNQEYAGAFVAHLSFSMEFSSVIKALSRFFARQIGRLQVASIEKTPHQLPLNDTYSSEDAKVLCGLNKIYQELCGETEHVKVPGLIIKRIRDIGPKSMAQPRTQTLLKAIKNRVQNQITWDDQKKFAWVESKKARLWLLAQELYIARREDEPRLAEQPRMGSREELEASTPRDHRLDVLKKVMRKYQELAGQHERLFICLSGLDRITDGSGDAFNPSHRSLFRLLNGSEDHKIQSIDPPIDLVLIAGRPDVPICYLSEELTKESLNKIDLGTRQQYSTLSRTKRWLKKWHPLPRFKWIERSRLVPIDCHMEKVQAKLIEFKALGARPDSHSPKSLTYPSTRLAAFLTWAESTDSAIQARPIDEIHSTSKLHRLLWENMGLSIWVMTLWMRLPDEPDGASQAESLEDFLNAFDRAAARDEFAGVLSAVLMRYRQIDKNEPEGIAIGGMDAELNDLILRHIVLFALPIEPWVLLGCPLIYQRLQRLYEAPKTKLRSTPDIASNKSKLRAWLDWHERVTMLRWLKNALDRLTARGLVIRVLPAIEAEPARDASIPEQEEDFLHHRFSIHARLREHLAHKMRLSVLDGGDLNHHRMSIYCDQPRDLPTPSAEHYYMVRDILDHQIRRCRETLTTTYQNSRAGQKSQRKSWDDSVTEQESKRNFGKAAARRVFAPDPDYLSDIEIEETTELGSVDKSIFDPNGIGGALGRIHAVPQRLRGCLSLLQGSFSMGSLSRLQMVETENGHKTPFETYRSWLRSLINAATGLERNRRELGDVLSGTLLVGHATARPSKFLRLINSEHERHIARENEKNVRQGAKDLKFGPRQESRYGTLRHPYYRDEIAWLYNERGLTSLIQGRILDALPLLKQARFIMSHKRTPAEDTHAYHAAERRIQLNYAIAQIERGNISTARRILDELEVTSQHIKPSKETPHEKGSTPSQTLYFARLYLGLCDHLSGSYQRALIQYQSVVEEFVTRKQLRAVAIANRHLADLYTTLDKLDDARYHVQLSINAAKQAQQQDVQHLALVSYARILLEEGELTEVQSLVTRALSYARQMGLYRLEIDALLIEGRLMTKRGEHVFAGEIASQAISLAVPHGLRLRKIAGLILLAETRIAAGSISLARNILVDAKAQAEQLGYQTQAGKAADLLSMNGVAENDSSTKVI